MDIQIGPGFGERVGRFKATVALQQADRVPFVPTMGNVSVLEYGKDFGVTMKDVMEDQTRVIPLLDRMLEDMVPDMFYGPDFFPKLGMDVLKPVNINYAGKTPEFGDNFTYQCLDHEFLDEDGYDDFIKDPSYYFMTKVLPEKFPPLAGLSMLNPYGLCGSTVMGFGALAAPPMQATLATLMEAGQKVGAYQQSAAAVSMHLLGKGIPVWGNCVCSSPFDDFADNIRGLLNTVMDLTVDPDMVMEAVNKYTDITIPATIGMAKMMHLDTVFIPLHVGVDEFMSLDNYNKYYWPPLKRMLEAYVASGLTPMVFCEGNYYTRLETLKDVPKGKIVYFFEKQDMLNAKKVLEGTAAVAGNFDSNLLAHGSPEQVTEETKRMLDQLAPGGGYIMSNNISLDVGKRENLAAWYEAVDKYGRY